MASRVKTFSETLSSATKLLTLHRIAPNIHTLKHQGGIKEPAGLGLTQSHKSFIAILYSKPILMISESDKVAGCYRYMILFDVCNPEVVCALSRVG